MNIERKLQEATAFLSDKINTNYEVGLILGSGLGNYADTIEKAIAISTADIPHYPKSTVEGHQGKIICGEKSGKTVFALQGRTHFYEGYRMEEVTFCIRLMSGFGVKKLIVTNAAGGINRNFKVGDLMLISDHINLMFSNPLIGKNLDSFGPRFPDMSEPYSKRYIKIAEEEALKLGFSFQKGVYCGLTGPSYETPAEIRMLDRIGGDAAGMSTVPDVIVARHCGMEVLGMSCITNLASGISDQKLSHEEVTETAHLVNTKFTQLLDAILPKLM